MNLNRLQVSKLVLDEYFAGAEFVPAVEAGLAEFGLMGSASTNSVTTPTSAIPLSHQLTSASPFVDSGVDLNVMGQFGGCRASIDEDEVFNGKRILIELSPIVKLFLCNCSFVQTVRQVVQSQQNHHRPYQQMV